MAQIDHEEGNQSVLGEVLAHIIIPPPLEIKKASLRSPWCQGRETEGGMGWGQTQRYIKTSGFSVIHCSDNNIFSAQA